MCLTDPQLWKGHSLNQDERPGHEIVQMGLEGWGCSTETEDCDLGMKEGRMKERNEGKKRKKERTEIKRERMEGRMKERKEGEKKEKKKRKKERGKG